MTDIDIAKQVKLKHINKIAEKLGVNPDESKHTETQSKTGSAFN